MAGSKKSFSGSSMKWLFFLPLLAGALYMLFMILHFGVNAPLADSWEMVTLFQKAGNHTLGFHDFWLQHNEHRIFFPLLVLMVNAYVTHWNTIAETVISFVFGTASATMIFLMLRKSLGNARIGLIAGVLVAAWFFSPVQAGNWTWGWQLEWFMCIAGIVATIYALTSFLDTRGKLMRQALFVIAGLSAFIATFSLANGIFAWVLGLFILAVGRQSRRAIISWAGAGLASTLLYYHNFISTPTPSGSPLSVATHEPLGFIKFFLVFIGGPVGSLTPDMQAPMIVGGLLLLCLLPLLYLVWERRNDLKPYLPWLSLILLGLLCALSTAFGRLGFGLEFALKSRYTAFSLLYAIGLIGLVFTLLVNTKELKLNTKRFIAWCTALLFIPLLVSSYNIGAIGFKRSQNWGRAVQACTRVPHPSAKCLVLIYPRVNVVRPRLEYVKARHWAGY